MYKYNKCDFKLSYSNEFEQEIKKLFKYIYLPKKKTSLQILGKYEIGRTLEVNSKYNADVSNNFSYSWETIDENNQWVEIFTGEKFKISNELLNKKLRLTAIYEKGTIKKIFRSKGSTIKSASVNTDDIINSDFLVKQSGNDTLRDILSFNGNTYENKLTYYINTNIGNQTIDTGFNLDAEKISLGEELFIESIFNKIDDLIDIDFERVYNANESLIDVYSAKQVGNTLGITYIDYGIKDGQRYYQSDVVFSASQGNSLKEFNGISSNTAYTIVHEIAHALGMRHPSDDPYGKWHTSEDTVMSYNFDTESALVPNLSPIDENALKAMWGYETDYHSEKIVNSQNYEVGTDNLKNSTFKFASSCLDVDGDGSKTQLGDGIMIVRKLISHSFGGENLLFKAVSPMSQRDSNEIHKFLEDNINKGIYDVDKDGETTAFGDGVMIYRALSRGSFLEDKLINGAISNQSPYFNQEKPWENILTNIDMLEI